MEESNTPLPFKKSSINLGVTLGLVFIVIKAIAFAFMVDLFALWWMNVIYFLLVVGIGMYAIINAKKMLDGFISFKEGFIAYFITIVIGLSLNIAFTFLLFNLIDDGSTAEKVKQLTI
ncbi:MAG: DUF4199 domain-containing protein, partial [Flavobacteriaceae bacterium]|nr:DUF4199 domain-containing protein [Flavobacteriaceae bacterium]